MATTSASVTSEALYPWPRPRETTRGQGTLKVTGPLEPRIVGGAFDLSAASLQVRLLLRQRAGQWSAGTGKPVELLVTDMENLPARSRAVRHPEGYVLTIAPRSIHLAGFDPAGVFYGAQTLAQLLEAHHGVLPCATVRDWPAFPVRGMHMYLPAADKLDFFCRLLDVLAELRYNTLFLEIGAGMEFQQHPEINRAWEKFCRQAINYDFRKDTRSPVRRHTPQATLTGPVALQRSRYFPKDSTHTELAGASWLTVRQVGRIAAEAARRHIRVVPEVQSWSHSYWLCCAHPEIAERRDDPWPDTYCPSNPRTYELLFECMDEVIDVLRPEMVNVGHDELMHIGHCPRCRGTSGHELLARDIRRIHAHLAERGIGMAMWADKLMPVEYGGLSARRVEPVTGRVWSMPATWQAIDRIPKDILMMDWYWSIAQQGDQKSVDAGAGSAKGISPRFFAEHGFRKAYGNWVDLEFQDWAGRSNPDEVLGAEVSSWCEPSADVLGHNRVVLDLFPAAQTLWSGRAMPKRQSCALAALWHPRTIDYLRDQPRWIVSPDERSVVPLDLGDAAGELPTELAGKLKTGKTMTTVLGTGSFSLSADKAGQLTRAVVLTRAAPSAGPIRVGRKCRRLLLLHGTTMEDAHLAMTFNSYDRGPAELIRYRVRYRDGKSRTFTARFGQHLGALEGFWPYPYLNWVYASAFLSVPAPIAAADRKFYVQEWVNPRPQSTIDTLEITLGSGATANGCVILAAASAVV